MSKNNAFNVVTLIVEHWINFSCAIEFIPGFHSIVHITVVMLIHRTSVRCVSLDISVGCCSDRNTFECIIT